MVTYSKYMKNQNPLPVPDSVVREVADQLKNLSVFQLLHLLDQGKIEGKLIMGILRGAEKNGNRKKSDSYRHD